MAKPRSAWAREANDHLQKYRAKMHAALKQSGQLDNYLNSVVERAKDEFAANVDSGMSALEAQSEARKNHLFPPQRRIRNSVLFALTLWARTRVSTRQRQMEDSFSESLPPSQNLKGN
jgi:hypothetical protein